MLKEASQTEVRHIENVIQSRRTGIGFISETHESRLHNYFPKSFDDNQYWFYEKLKTFVPTLFLAFLLALQKRNFFGAKKARIVRLAAARLDGPADLRGTVIANIAPPLPAENYEGLAVRRRKDGAVDLFVISDGNFNPLLDNVLLQFRYSP